MKYVLFFLLFSLSACFNTKALIEPSAQPRELVGTAIIMTPSPLLRDGRDLITIKRINGKPGKHWEHKWVVSPGTHELEVEVDIRKPAQGSDLTYVTKAIRSLALQADADRNYLVDAIEDSRGLWVWVVDEETGVVVAGEAPPEKLRRGRHQ